MDCERIGKLLYNLRKEKDMTQKQLADLMNISDKAISKWERGLGCVCPQCNNLMTATGDANISCCGKRLEALVAAKATENHLLNIEPIEDELYVSSSHEMKKEHYITFVAYVTGDRVFIVKQYPEWNMQFRFNKSGHGKLYFHCSNHGLFYQLI